MKGQHLGEFEELVLLATGILSSEAYGFSVQQEIERQTGRTASLAAIHTALYRLQEKGYVDSILGGASSKRGGRRKRLYSITASGMQALSHARSVRERLWSALQQVQPFFSGS